jgi:hypothetical protein
MISLEEARKNLEEHRAYMTELDRASTKRERREKWYLRIAVGAFALNVLFSVVWWTWVL